MLHYLQHSLESQLSLETNLNYEITLRVRESCLFDFLLGFIIPYHYNGINMSNSLVSAYYINLLIALHLIHDVLLTLIYNHGTK